MDFLPKVCGGEEVEIIQEEENIIEEQTDIKPKINNNDIFDKPIVIRKVKEEIIEEDSGSDHEAIDLQDKITDILNIEVDRPRLSRKQSLALARKEKVRLREIRMAEREAAAEEKAIQRKMKEMEKVLKKVFKDAPLPKKKEIKDMVNKDKAKKSSLLNKVNPKNQITNYIKEKKK